MYLPKHFNHSDPAIAQRIMAEHPLASIVSVGADGSPVLSHIPMHWQAASLWPDGPQSEHGVLLGHCARANPQAQLLASQPQALVSFMGPQAYMSPSVYSEKQRVPTWSYLAVQVKVLTRIIDPHEDRDRLLKCLIAEHEPAYAQQWRELPAHYTGAMLNGIVAFEMQITDLQCAVKLNQHRPEAHAAMHKAYAQGTEQTQELARWMKDLGLVP
ncbi:MAG: FMN-binding negative transcriptional regulator [Hydrogenophaga sp.]|nr:FMN-binding negative transcriptional regulator [Hydrogenophaga sp.]